MLFTGLLLLGRESKRTERAAVVLSTPSSDDEVLLLQVFTNFQGREYFPITWSGRLPPKGGGEKGVVTFSLFIVSFRSVISKLWPTGQIWCLENFLSPVSSTLFCYSAASFSSQSGAQTLGRCVFLDIMLPRTFLAQDWFENGVMLQQRSKHPRYAVGIFGIQWPTVWRLLV